MKKLYYFLITFLFLSTISFGQITKWKSSEVKRGVTLKQWEVNDISFKVNPKINNPFEKEVYALFSSDNLEQKIPLFYNGNGEYILRYSSSTIGEKTFVLTSNIKQLKGKKGKITVTENDKENRKGGIVLNENNKDRLFYEDGSHYFNLAFECDWLFALDYEKEELTKTKHLLSLLNKNGFNQVVMNVYSHDVSWPKDSLLSAYPEFEYGGKQDMFPFLGSNENPDFSSLNMHFFNHFDKVIAEMHDQEIISHLMIYVWNKMVSWPDMNTVEDNRYYDYVIKRYQAFPNIVWDVSKEALFYGRATKEYISERIERTRKLDAFNRLVSVHDYGFCKNHPEEVDFISMQNWQHTLYQNMMNAKNDFPDKPIFNIEHGGYEESPFVVFPGAYVNAEACLRRNYMCLFAGGYTTYYWQGASWNVVIHNPFEQADNFMKPHFEYFKYMRTLFESVHFENMEPMTWFNSSGYNLTSKIDGEVLMYIPKENNWVGSNQILKKAFSADNATQQWFNTLTGEMTEEVKYDRKSFNFWKERPWEGEADVILIIRNLKEKSI